MQNKEQLADAIRSTLFYSIGEHSYQRLSKSVREKLEDEVLLLVPGGADFTNDLEPAIRKAAQRGK